MQGTGRLSPSPLAGEGRGEVGGAARLLRGLCLLLLGLSLPAAAGQFTASQECPAFQSMVKGTNPGNVQTAPGSRYPVLEQMQRQGQDWVRIAMPQAQPAERWVQASCGSTQEGQGSAPAAAARNAAPASGNPCRTPDLYDSWVLALSWQPGFCEHKGGARKPECQALDAGRLQAAHLSIHGLWPNRRQCGIDYADCGNARLDLTPATRKALQPWMPNLQFEPNGGLARHEWSKHGTCQTRWDDDGYFQAAVAATRLIDDSALGLYIRANIGGEVSRRELQAKLAQEYPAAAGSLSLLCSGSHLYEIRLGLPREFRTDMGLGGLFGNQPPKMRPARDECRGERLRIEAGGR